MGLYHDNQDIVGLYHDNQDIVGLYHDNQNIVGLYHDNQDSLQHVCFYCRTVSTSTSVKEVRQFAGLTFCNFIKDSPTLHSLMQISVI